MVANRFAATVTGDEDMGGAMVVGVVGSVAVFGPVRFREGVGPSMGVPRP